VSAPQATFKDRAAVCIKYGLPVIWVKPEEKATNLPKWEDLATTDLRQIEIWNNENPARNVGCVAKAKIGGFWFLDIDKEGTKDRIEAETGRKIPLKWMSRSRKGRGHIAFKQTAASIAMGNIAEESVRDGAFSCRVNDMYIVGPGSYRKDLDRTYELILDSEPEEAPDWLIQWCIAQKVSRDKTQVNRDENNLIPHGQIHPALVSEAGSLCARGYSVEAREEALLLWAHENCAPPLDENHIRQVARSTEGWEQGNPLANVVLVGGKVAGDSTPIAAPIVSTPEIDTADIAVYPTFPRWTARETSLFKGLVEPAVQTSSKYLELIWMPSIQLMLNHLFGKVRIKDQQVNLNMYLGLISPYGQFFKSSSCELAHKYFETMGLLASYRPGMSNADGKIIVMQAGSTEGFGKTMSTINAKHGVLYNDELSKMVSKAGIENASFSHDLLQWYGSSGWGNTVTNAKNSFAFPAGSYCFSWQWCTTDRGFNRQWPRIASIASGMEDRLFFVMSPKEPRPTVPYTDPFLGESCARTRLRLEEAINQGVYGYQDIEGAVKLLSGMDPRSMQLAQMLALYFAVDLEEDGERLTEITPECVERALALTKYRNDVRAYIEPIEADTVLGRIQKEILREIRQAGGKVKKRDLQRSMDHQRYGSDLWRSAYIGAIKEQWIVEWEEVTPAGRKSRMVGIPKEQED
jgi:hypothetical protein